VKTVEVLGESATVGEGKKHTRLSAGSFNKGQISTRRGIDRDVNSDPEGGTHG